MNQKTIKNRYDFVYLFDVKDGNPNGDPDAGNQPRVDPETGHGLVTDVSLKRKVRNYISISKKFEPPYDIYIKEGTILTDVNERSYHELKEEPVKKINSKKDQESVSRARSWICQNFYDVRTFGAVMSLDIKAGVVKGPIQLTFARSIDPIFSLEHSITRMAKSSVSEGKNSSKEDGDGKENKTMGRKHTVSYGLYVARGFISAHFAEDTGFSEEDLEIFWKALQNMWDHDRSAARGEMACRGLYIFKHEGDEGEAKLGVAPAHKLFEMLSISRKPEIETPRQFSDYVVSLDDAKLKKEFPKINLIQFS